MLEFNCSALDFFVGKSHGASDAETISFGTTQKLLGICCGVGLCRSRLSKMGAQLARKRASSCQGLGPFQQSGLFRLPWLQQAEVNLPKLQCCLSDLPMYNRGLCNGQQTASYLLSS